ncbi:MAG: hypothetical protein WCK65_14565 [Rhodospirillaceae bacterium]
MAPPSGMLRIFLTLVLVLVASLAPAKLATAQLFDPYLIGMMAGPVSDGPSLLLLKKRRDKFMSSETLVIACSAGAVSGLVAHGLPLLAVAAGTGIAAPLGPVALVGASLFGCIVSAGAGAVAIGTQWLLNMFQTPPKTGFSRPLP